MSDTVFTKVDYNLETLLNQIALGTIGLPDIQRPFVWNNVKVRDLFDSMYRGYPVDYLLLWRNGLADDKTIGTEAKAKAPSLVIVDGQQRLTSLFAVVRGQPVLRKNYNSERIQIAFNPIEGRFEVADAATRRDKSFIPDISRVWSDGLFNVARDYLTGLRLTREVNGDEERTIQDRRKCEYDLFRSVEEAVELPLIKAGFSTIDEFTSLAQRILQRRKARSGRSLELHVREILLEEGLKEHRDFAHGPITEAGKRPDFLFPSETAYRDSSFPTSRLKMLAVKTTCKDRWRQILNEADRIQEKHLLTLQEGVSVNQFREMRAASVRLVVPETLLAKYPPEVHPDIQTLAEFIDEAAENCAC